MDRRRVGIACAAVLGGAAAAGAAACALVAPRRASECIDARWKELCRYRYAHRGLFDLAAGLPENSLAAFRRARDLGFGVELDVHLTRDRRLVVVHDSDLDRVCGVRRCVEDLTLDEVRRLRLCGTEEGIPLLAEVLRLFEIAPAGADDRPAAAPLIVEAKPHGGNACQLMERLMACLDSYDVRYCVESFDPVAVAWLRHNRPEVVRGQLVDSPAMATADVLSRPDFVACRFEHRSAPALALARRLGARPVTWTIRTMEDLLASEAMGASGIFEGFVPVEPRPSGVTTQEA